MSQKFQETYHSHILEKKEAGMEMESIEMNVSLQRITLLGEKFKSPQHVQLSKVME